MISQTLHIQKTQNMQASAVKYKRYADHRILISEREHQVLEMISFGHSTEEIAEELFLSSETIKSHRRSLLVKFRARNTAQLIRIAFEGEYLKKEF